jgi:RNA polymerase sigma-70 factor, ECF subfamily
MARVAQGDARAFRALSDAHLKPVYVYLTRLLHSEAEAQDVAQETFLRVWQNASSYQPKARITTWIHAIARHLAIDRLRRRKTTGEHFEFDDERDLVPRSDRPSELLEKKTTAQLVAQAIARLPERQQSALLLCHEQGLSQPEIAVVLECTVDAVESLLKRARSTLREQLQSLNTTTETP